MAEQRSYYYIMAILVLITLASIAFTVISSKSAASKSSLEECKTVQYMGEDKINLLFFGSENQAEDYSAHFLNTEPYDRYKDSFNIYYIDSFQPQCDMYKGIAITCDSKEMRKKAASCPSDIIVVLKDEEATIRSSATRNIISLNTVHPETVLTHELGHAIATLAEEYHSNQNPARGSTNCQKTCGDFNKEINGCFQECSKGDLFRSIENGVMRTLSSNEYGIYNNGVIESLILKRTGKAGAPITGNQVSSQVSCINEESVLINLNTQESELINGCSSPGIGLNDYTITDQSGDVIFSGFYNDEFLFTDAPVENSLNLEGETYEDPQLDSFLIVDYGGKTLNIQNAQIDITEAGARPCRI